MKTLNGNNTYLRALEPSDLEFLFQIENNEDFWAVSNTQKPFSKFVLKQYLDNAHQDIFNAKQLRLVIVDKSNDNPIGMIDLFDFEPKHKRAGIGILIEPKSENKGFASEALNLIVDYTFTHLDLHQVYANITEDNSKSIQLFENARFSKVGCKKDWTYIKGTFKDEFIYQKIND
jgi:diamine N-acetyltransferase